MDHQQIAVELWDVADRLERLAQQVLNRSDVCSEVRRSCRYALRQIARLDQMCFELEWSPPPQPHGLAPLAMANRE